jgi:hypothetical protein
MFASAPEYALQRWIAWTIALTWLGWSIEVLTRLALIET